MTKVLIIEDDPMVAMLNQQFIEKIANVEIVGNVRNVVDARKIMATTSVDLLLLDVYLPGMTGLEFLTELHEQKLKIAVILITASNDMATVKEAIYFGVVDYLIKPFTFERFKLAFDKFQELESMTLQTKGANQSALDKYFNSPGKVTLEKNKSLPVLDLPKGLSPLTLDKIYQQILTHSDKFSTKDLANEVGLSRISTKKYLLFLIDIQVLQEELEYLEVGRPLTLYKIKKGGAAKIAPYLK